MISDIYWINHPFIGDNKIGTMARPRGDDWLENEIKWLKLKEIDCLISVLESSEIWELKLEKEEELCSLYQIEFINFPIKDVSIPYEEKEFIKLTELLVDKIKKGKKIVVHCRMGIGRSSMLVASVMIKMGCKAINVFDIIKKYRKLNVPDTEEQKKWVLQLESKLTKNNN